MAAGDGVLGSGRGGARYPVSDDYIVIALQASTQLDGFGHVGGDSTLYNGYWAGLVTATGGAPNKACTTSRRASLAARSPRRGAPSRRGAHLEPGFPIGPDELDGAAAAQDVRVGPGDIVLVHTGHVGWKLGLAAGSPDALTRSEPGISTRAIPWLHDHDVAMIATDTAACSTVPPSRVTEFSHGASRAARPRAPRGAKQLFDLDELAADCAADGVSGNFFVAAPMPIVGARAGLRSTRSS